MDPDEHYIIQDRHVRKAIETDTLTTKELVLRKKLIERLPSVPKLQNFPYLVDVEYLCFDDPQNQLHIRAGQGDLLLTNGKNQFVAVEIKSSFVCYDGSDRIFMTKTSKLLEQVQYYTTYQRHRRPDAIVHGCGVTEQKIYWWDADGKLEEYWWSSGPCMSYKSPVSDSCFAIKEDLDMMSDELQDLHLQFEEEAIARVYPTLIKINSEQGTLTYLSKCKQKRMTVSKSHLSQNDINDIIQEYNQNGFDNGHILMFGMTRPTLITVGSQV